MSWEIEVIKRIIKASEKMYENTRSTNDILDQFYCLLASKPTEEILNYCIRQKGIAMLSQDILNSLDILTEKQAKVFKLHFLENKTLYQIIGLNMYNLRSTSDVKSYLEEIFNRFATIAPKILLSKSKYAEILNFDSIPVTKRYNNPNLIKIKELNLPVSLEHIIMSGIYTSFKPKVPLINENRVTLGYTIEAIDNLFDVKSCGPIKAIEIIQLYNNLNIDTTKWEKALSKHELHILNKKRAELVDTIRA